MIKTELYFGRTIGVNGYVIDKQWEAFVNDHIVSRFPTGFSIIDIIGYWKHMASGQTVKERTKMLTLCHHKTDNDDKHLLDIITEYKQLFDQESVMLVEYEVNVAF
jgi:UDP-N-acetylglucosamine 2-epimerase